MLIPRFIVGFVGHREDFSEDHVRRALRATLKMLKGKAAEAGGGIDLLSSVARGTDTVCVEIAREMNIPVHIVLPLEADDFAVDFVNHPDDWRRAKELIEFAGRRPGDDSVRVVNGEAHRPECYFNQIVHILDASEVLVAVWDGLPSRGQGGTAQAVGQARALGIPTIIIDPKTGSSADATAGSLFLPHDEVIERLNEQWKATPGIATGAVDNPQKMQESLDAIAVAAAGRFRPSLVIMILMHGIAAMLATLVLYPFAPHVKPLITGSELVLVSVALALAVALHKSEIRARWLDCRFACELLSGLRATATLLDALHPAIDHHDRRWRRFAVSAGLLVQRHAPSFNVVALRDLYLETRLGETHPESQIRHFRKQRPGADRWWRWTRNVGYFCAMSAPVFVAFSLVNKLAHFGLDKHFVGWMAVSFFPIALPMAAGIAAGIRQALDVQRRSHRYPEIAGRLEAMRTHIRFLETPSTIRRGVACCEEILLDELIEWHMAAQSTEAH